MKTVLVPLDFSGVSGHVVDVAVELATALNGRVLLFHVVQPLPMLTGMAVEVENVAEMTAAMEKAAESQLTDLKKALGEKSVEIQTWQLTGHPAVAIVEEARKIAADYIVIGSHGHTAVYDLVAGSTAHAVLGRATCPVVVVPRR